MKGKCSLCGDDSKDGNEKLEQFRFEDIWVVIDKKYKWVCRECLRIINWKAIHGNEARGLPNERYMGVKIERDQSKLVESSESGRDSIDTDNEDIELSEDTESDEKTDSN